MMVVTCSNYSVRMDCPEAALPNSALKHGTTEIGMNNFSYEDPLREDCIRSASPMPGVLISAGMPMLDEVGEGD